MLRRWWPFFVAAGVVVADRWTKSWIENSVRSWDTIRVIPGLFQIVHVRNTGIAFGIFSDQGPRSGGNLLLIVFSLLVMSMVSWTLWRECRGPKREHWTLQAALALVLGGACGNLIDRIAFGSVTDFLDFYWGGQHFPIFNLADSAITVGAGLLLINLWVMRKPAGHRAGASS